LWGEGGPPDRAGGPRLQPDHLAAEARRWIGQIGYSTEPAVITAVRAALERYYEDLAVIDGITHWRVAKGLKPEQPFRAAARRAAPPPPG